MTETEATLRMIRRSRGSVACLKRLPVVTQSKPAKTPLHKTRASLPSLGLGFEGTSVVSLPVQRPQAKRLPVKRVILVMPRVRVSR